MRFHDASPKDSTLRKASDFESEDWLYLALPDHLPVNEQKEKKNPRKLIIVML